MKLKQFYGKTVKITTENGQTFIGKVDDYFYPEDNEREKESIAMNAGNGNILELYEDDIVTIEITKI